VRVCGGGELSTLFLSPCAVEDRSALVLASAGGGSDVIRLWDVERRIFIREWKGEEKDGNKVVLRRGFFGDFRLSSCSHGEGNGSDWI